MSTKMDNNAPPIFYEHSLLETRGRIHPGMLVWDCYAESWRWTVMAYLRWKTAVAFVRDTASGMGHFQCQIIREHGSAGNGH